MQTQQERVAQDIALRLQACFPEYRIDTEVWEMGFQAFVGLHLSRDGRDHWVELIPDGSGGERRVDMASFHLQASFLPPSDSRGLQHFRQHLVQRFILEWFGERMKRAGLEP